VTETKPKKPADRPDSTGQKLSLKERKFRDEYLKSHNATQAAIKAGYAKTTADKKCSMWVGKSREACPANKRHVWDAVHTKAEEITKKAGIDAEYIMRRHVEIDNLDIKDILDDDGNMLGIHQWPDAWTKSLSAIEVSQILEDGASIGTLKKIKWPDKLKNIELMGKLAAVGAYRDNINLTADDALTARILAGRQRVKK